LASIGGHNPLSYKSDGLKSLEIGTKNTLLGGRASFDSSIYRINWSDIQRGVAMPTCLNGYTDNLGEATVTGIDLEFQVQMTRRFRLSLAWGHNNGEFSEDTVKFGQTYALKGQEFPQPKVVANASLYYVGTSAKRNTFATLTVNYSGPYVRTVPFGVVGYAENEQVIRDAEAVTVANLRAGLQFGNWKPALFVENLFDSNDTVGQFLTAAGRTDVTSRGLRPRTVGLAVDYKF
jgi:outer membrane receptor protein involved in Fe transport